MYSEHDADDSAPVDELTKSTPEQQRIERLEGLAALAEACDDAMIGVTLDGAISIWNSAAEHLYGYTLEDVVGEPISVIVPPERAQEILTWLDAAQRGERVRYRDTLRRARSGLVIEVAESVSPIRDAEGVVIGASVVDRDVTEQRWMASALDTALEKLEAALVDARESETRSRRFLADAAHQLRTPITGIRLSAENILLGAEPAERDRLLSDLVRETIRAGRLVASLLRVARLDEGEPIVPAPCDLVSLCADEVDRAWALSPQLNFGFRAEGEQTGEPHLDADAVREILGNLLDNARRHATSQIEVVVRWGGSGVEVRVTDDGAGVECGMEERMFERLVSAGDGGGSGLGLSIARELARAHGGELYYERPHFVLRLPMEPDVGSPEEPGET